MSQLKKLFKKESKKILALLLAIALLLSFHPGFVFANPNCGLEEHTHGTDCFVLDCDLDDEDHQHDDFCYELICKKTAHTHSEDCETSNSRMYTDLNTFEFETGLAHEFTVRLVANENEGKNVVLSYSFDEPRVVEKFEYYDSQLDQWIALDVEGDESPEFAMSNCEQKLRATFSEEGYYYLAIALLDAETEEELCFVEPVALVNLRRYKIVNETPEGSKGCLYFPEEVEEGDNILIEIETEMPYELKSLFVNGENVTNDVVDMEYVIENVCSDIVLKAEFGLFSDDIIVLKSIEFEIDTPEVGKKMPNKVVSVATTPEIEINKYDFMVYWYQHETESDPLKDAWTLSDYNASFEPNLYYYAAIDWDLPENVYIDRSDFVVIINGDNVDKQNTYVRNHEDGFAGAVSARKAFDKLTGEGTVTPNPEEPKEQIEISKIDIKIDAPVANNPISESIHSISFDKDVPVGKQDVIVGWKESDTEEVDENTEFMPYNAQFKNGKYYHLMLSFDLPDGFVWAENVKATINGIDVDDPLFYHATEKVDAFFYATHCFDDLADQTPETPDTPENPENPDDPKDPEDPTDPNNPQNPSEPENPDTPTDPETPNDPTDPETPDQPEQPNNPTDPSEPSDPSEPEKPNEPTEPETPSNPETPNEPQDPADPSEPSNPTPDDPETPDTPTDPSKPSEPSDPDDPNEPETPDEPEKPAEHKHVLTKVASKKATCTEKGNAEYFTCECGKWFSDSEGATEITNKSDVEIAATGHKAAEKLSCDNNSHWHKCSVCGKVADEKVAHKFDEAGKICQDCGYDVDNPKTGDNFDINLTITLMIVSLFGLIGTIGYIVYDKKRKH